MKDLYLNKVFLFLSILFIASTGIFCQVPMPITVTPGWDGLATVKWDNLNYLVNTGNYITPSVYVTAAMSTTQAFAIGTNRVTIAISGVTTTAQNSTNSGYANSYASVSTNLSINGTTLNSVAYNGSGTVTLVFDTVVSHLGFSLYDIDVKQTATITASDASGNALNITMSNAAAVGAINTIAGSGTTSATATAANTTAGSASNTGTVNVYVDGFAPAGTNGVKTVTITMAGTAGDFWLSDITACVYSGFPTSYYSPAKPYTGEPAYTIANSNAATASMVNVATGKAKYIFTDNSAGNPYINSFGYDLYNRYLYYTLDYVTSPAAGNTKSVKKYDFNTLGSTTATMSSGTISTIINDVTAAPFNIPVFDQGVTSGGAAFYAGSLYIGIEGSNAYAKYSGSTSNSGRYSMIWRIDFNSSGTPVKACQVFAIKADNGSGTLLHDWSDFSISNGILYDFSGAGTTNNRVYHYNLETGLIAFIAKPNGAPIPGQTAVDWNENIYSLLSAGNKIQPYNKTTGVFGAQSTVSGSNTSDWTPTGSGDASEAFLPPLDFGDAPDTYESTGTDPATHDYDSTLKLGTLWNAEFAKKTTSDASGDGTTDDGVPVLPNFTYTQTTYSTTVNVYNHTGGSVTVAGWIDVNNDGVFDPSEGTTTTLATSSTSLQSVTLTWSSLPNISPSAYTIFMRIRVTSAANGLTAANPTGYFSNGEVEDYQLVVVYVLPVKLVSFSATENNNSYVDVDWSIATEMNMKEYIIERSGDGLNWSQLKTVVPDNNPVGTKNYAEKDMSPISGISYYRIAMIDYGGNISYSNIQKVNMDIGQFAIEKVTPNPFQSTVTIKASLPADADISIRLTDINGKTLKSSHQSGLKGDNSIQIDNLGDLPAGIYIVEITSNSITIQQKLVKE